MVLFCSPWKALANGHLFLDSSPIRRQCPVEWGDFPSVHPSVWAFTCSFVYLSPPLWPSQPGLWPSQSGLGPSQPALGSSQPSQRSREPGLRPREPGLRPREPGLRTRQPGLWPRQLARRQASSLADWASGLAGRLRGHKRMDGQANIRKISPFYRTLSPIGAAALLPPWKPSINSNNICVVISKKLYQTLICI